jgi:hypothetical protein
MSFVYYRDIPIGEFFEKNRRYVGALSHYAKQIFTERPDIIESIFRTITGNSNAPYCLVDFIIYLDSYLFGYEVPNIRNLLSQTTMRHLYIKYHALTTRKFPGGCRFCTRWIEPSLLQSIQVESLECKTFRPAHFSKYVCMLNPKLWDYILTSMTPRKYLNIMRAIHQLLLDKSNEIMGYPHSDGHKVIKRLYSDLMWHISGINIMPDAYEFCPSNRPASEEKARLAEIAKRRWQFGYVPDDLLKWHTKTQDLRFAIAEIIYRLFTATPYEIMEKHEEEVRDLLFFRFLMDLPSPK